MSCEWKYTRGSGIDEPVITRCVVSLNNDCLDCDACCVSCGCSCPDPEDDLCPWCLKHECLGGCPEEYAAFERELASLEDLPEDHNGYTYAENPHFTSYPSSGTIIS